MNEDRPGASPDDEAPAPEGPVGERSAQGQRDVVSTRRDESSEQRDESSTRRDGASTRRDGLSTMRDGSSLSRDESAVQRDASSATRDRLADDLDDEAARLDARDDVADGHTLGVPELRGRSRAGRTRAADNRARARHDREHSGEDRHHAEDDRMESRGDRHHALDDREHSGTDRERAEGDREEAMHDREHAEDDRGDAEQDRDQAQRDRESAGIDELTGARRRGVGLEDLENEIRRARREGGSRLVVAYVDVDGLKSINDAHGHAAGDELLRAVATGLRREMRVYDLLVRLGGDEFLGVLPNLGLDAARERFGRVQSDLALSGNAISIGFTELREDDSAHDVVERADAALLSTRASKRHE